MFRTEQHKYTKFNLNSNMKAENVIRESVADMFGMLEYKVRNGVMSFDDVQSLVTLFEVNGGIKATTSDLANYYHQSEDNVRHILHRSFMPKPIRRVYYDMFSFAKNVPSKWRQKGSTITG